ncbi:putative biopolymer transport protein ExbB-like 3 [Hyella patelloides LEGE 07179]|uniref:Putative biopolymer transport protein ExbB-like 3 n=1 Tax=Hyella patelloides LEGE 07179 TaxID=945734 RepID=A0A563W3D1_9CYAN|nr:MotA/TolQ/ExbB proton channel family protein [Hyella patelloides]VEP18186.1 putative biopolymer transport protein ExbB-like 3 [Hyella patelloides LEGE 07179]
METVFQLFKNGGVVMFPLLGLSIFSLAMILERSLFWLKLTRKQGKVLKKGLNLYEEAPEMADIMLKRNQHLPIARIFLAALSLKRPTPEKFRLALESAAQAEIPLLKRFSNSFDIITSVSPLLGLLGTVLGLITSLASLRIGEIESSQATGVTGGISEALTSTAAGLVIAIVTLFFASTFRGLYLQQIALIQEFSSQLELLHLDKYEQKGEIDNAITR